MCQSLTGLMCISIQLDEARQPGQEKEEEDGKTCDAEENAIEMSDDFDGKLQDMEEGGDIHIDI